MILHAAGNRVSRVKDGVVTTWVNDAEYRLTGQEKSGQAATFVYDNAGNLTEGYGLITILSPKEVVPDDGDEDRA